MGAAECRSRRSHATVATVGPIKRPPVQDLDVLGVPTREMSCEVVLDRIGDRADLVEAMIARFPVMGLGHRHAAMNQAVGNLLGSGFHRALVAMVLGDWHAHFHALGLTRTGLDEAAREVSACICSTVRSIGTGDVRAGDERPRSRCHLSERV